MECKRTSCQLQHLSAQKVNQSHTQTSFANDTHRLSCGAVAKKVQHKHKSVGVAPPSPPPNPTYRAATTQIRAQAHWPRPSPPSLIP